MKVLEKIFVIDLSKTNMNHKGWYKSVWIQEQISIEKIKG
jgi:hypothetical protein